MIDGSESKLSSYALIIGNDQPTLYTPQCFDITMDVRSGMTFYKLCWA